MVRKPTPGEWRMTLDFVQLNAATRGLEGWPIPNIQQTLARLGTLKPPKLFGLLDFTAGYHQTHLDPASRAYTPFSATGELYQWTRVAMALKGSGPYFQRMSNAVLTDLVYHICELYIDDVLIHEGDPTIFLANIRKVFSRLREFNVAVNPKKTKWNMLVTSFAPHGFLSPLKSA
jgi:hypothetical protein